jgi:hypothetical protein
MSEIMDDYDAGLLSGKKFAQNKVLYLMDEVIREYETQYNQALKDMTDKELDWGDTHTELQSKFNAVTFMKSWVLSGGMEDEDGNRACLPW